MEDAGVNERVQDNPVLHKAVGIIGLLQMFPAVLRPPPGERVLCLLEETKTHIREFLYATVELQGKKH